MGTEQEASTDERESYWFVYLYKYDAQHESSFLFQPVGIVDDREKWMDWWEKVQTGEVELPFPFGKEGWWCSDRPVKMGLPNFDDRRNTEQWEPAEGTR